MKNAIMPKIQSKCPGVALIAASLLFASSPQAADTGRILVANRTSGTLSVIDAASDTLVKSVSVAAKYARPPEPMYVNYCAKYHRLLVNDRANNQVIAMDADTYEVVNAAPTGKGAFHMWTDGSCKQTWSVNDVDKTFTVLHPGTLQVLATVPIPADLAEQGGKPHDIVLDKKGASAFATIVAVGAATDSDYVVQYSTKTFKEIARRAVGKDPHLGLPGDGKLLFVPTQNANKVYVLNPKKSLEEIKQIEIPGAHGAGWTPDGKLFYTSNLPGADLNGNKDMLWAIDATTLEIAGAAAFPAVPPGEPRLKAAHNIAIDGTGRKLYLTHSGHDDGDSAGDVTIYDISAGNPVPQYRGRITVGLNPFGIAFAPDR
jgi:YVTN family beta-propeller protein